MTDSRPRGSTCNTRLIRASAEAIYAAFTEPAALAVWQAPGEMTAEVHRFDLRVGGGYEMSLFYPEAEQGSPGKTGSHEDRYTARFLELTPSHRIVQAIVFDAADPAFSGEMTMAVMLAADAGGTMVTIEFTELPPGVRPEDNEAGTEQSLAKLARYVE